MGSAHLHLKINDVKYIFRYELLAIKLQDDGKFLK